jgi:Ser/Thr protein kinase RdoA (MazF antagonist)
MATDVMPPDDSDDDLDDGGEVVGVLAQRLEQLRDPRWLTGVLDSALAQMAAAPVAVTGHDIEYCKIKPNRDINVAVRARLSAGGAAAVPQLLSCTLYANAEACRLRNPAAGVEPVAAATRARLAAAGLQRPFAVLDDPAMVVHAFPVDPALPGLAPATTVEAMLPLFAARLQDRRRAPRELLLEVLHYKPRRSCAIHYTMDADGGAQPARVYGKLSRDDRGAFHNRLLAAAHAASLRGDGLWQAARPVAWVPEWRLLLQEAVPGRDFRLVFAELTPDQATAAQLERAGSLLDAIARAVHDLQRAPVTDGPTMTFERLLAAQDRNLHYMTGLQPQLAADLAAIRQQAARLAGTIPAGPLVFSHGDFAHGNVLVDGDRVGIIDFDKAGAAEAAYDVAYFLTHMWSFGIRHEKRMPHVVQLCARFRAAYAELAPEVSARRLALYEALDFAAYVLRNFRKQSHQANWLHWARAQVAAAWDRLAVAAGNGVA